jgi:hypothetical protein
LTGWIPEPATNAALFFHRPANQEALMPKMEKKVLAYGLFVALIGILLILSTLRFEEAYKPLSHVGTIIANLMDHIGIAFVSIGMIGIIVDLNDWRKYFQERIADTIIQKNYLERLDHKELINLQTNTLKVLFKAEDIEREESLLNFLHTKIHGFIGSPYREGFDGRLSIECSDDAYIVEETTTYKCRTVGDSIQDKVKWAMNKENEKEGLDDYSVTIEIPNNFFQSPEFRTQYPKVSAQKLTICKGDERFDLAENGLGFSFPLLDYKKIDGLFVEVFAKYRVSANRDIVWIMALPTKRFTSTVNYPRTLRLDATILGVDQREYRERVRSGVYSLSYDAWMLPTTGIMFHIWEPKAASAEKMAGDSHL